MTTPQPIPIIVDARTSHVTVYEDRADVTRRARVELPAGPSELVVRALSPLIDEARLIARFESAIHAQVDDVRIERRFVIDGADVIEARRRERAAARQAHARAHAPLVAALKHAEHQRATLESLGRAGAIARARRVGRGDVDVGAAATDHERLRQALARADAQLLQARTEVARSEERHKALEAPLERGPGHQSRPVCDVVMRVSTREAGVAELVLSTVVPCAAWRPCHEAALTRDSDDAATGVVRFVGAGTIWNRTGETWHEAALTLSTARPSQGAQLPPLVGDRLWLRPKSVEERKTIVVEHRAELVPKSAVSGAAPGVDDGGDVQAFMVPPTTIPDDGRPHRTELFRFEAPAAVAKVAFPERSPLVFVRASFKNAGRSPILAGPVAISDRGAFLGTADLLYCGVGDDVDLAFGSDDGVRVSYERSCLEDKKLVGKNVRHWVQRATVYSTRRAATAVQLTLRWPVSEVAQIKVLHSATHSTIPEPKVDAHGLVRVPVTVDGGHDKVVAVAFTFETSGDVRLPDPW
jgi:uncharacterized protein (TIGR02231 family)